MRIQLTQRLRLQDFEAKTRGVQLEALYDVGLAIASTLDFERLVEEILMRAVSLADARRGALYLEAGERLRLERAFGGDAAPSLDLADEEVAALLAGRATPNCCALPGAQHLFGVPILSDGEARVLISGDGGKSFETIFKAPSGNASGLALDPLDGSLVIGTTGASTWELPGASPYVVRGEGTAGTGGFVPRLLPVGGLPQPGNSAFGLAADRLLGGRNSLLLVSVHEGAAPVFGGTLFALPPFFFVEVVATGGTSGVGGSGSFTRVFGIPNQLALLGLSVVSQLVVADSGGPLGHARVLSNGLRITFGP